MEVLSGETAGDRPPPLPPPPGRRYLRRQASLALTPSNMFLFRPPKPTYVATSWPGELCVLGSSVCLALERAGGASKVLLFCHGTSSDLGMSRRSLEIMREGLDCHVVGVEYPGYGLTADGEPTEQSINAAVRVAFLHLTEVMGWPAERVIVMGRSLGSGPAARLAREFQPGALFLLAPFTGVGDIAGSIVGDTLASMFKLNQWDNKKEVAATASPTLILHGLKDQVVPHTHGLDLYRASAASKKYVGLLLESDHNRIGWRVVCDIYARPFMEMVCPEETGRSLGIRPTDVEKLSNFDPSGKAGALILACAKAAWERRRQEEEEELGESAAYQEAAARVARVATALATHKGSNPLAPAASSNRGDGDGRASAAWGVRAPPSPSGPPVSVSSMSGSSISSSPVSSVSSLAAPGDADVAAPTAVATAAAGAGAKAESSEERTPTSDNNRKGWLFGLGLGTGQRRDGDSGGGNGVSAAAAAGTAAMVGVGVGGWGTGTVRAPAFEGLLEGSGRSCPKRSSSGSINIGSSSGSSSVGSRSSGSINIGRVSSSGSRSSGASVSSSDGGAEDNGNSNVSSSSSSSRSVEGTVGGAVILGGAAGYSAVLGAKGDGPVSDGEEERDAGAGAEAGRERGWGKLSRLFSGR